MKLFLPTRAALEQLMDEVDEFIYHYDPPRESLYAFHDVLFGLGMEAQFHAHFLKEAQNFLVAEKSLVDLTSRYHLVVEKTAISLPVRQLTEELYAPYHGISGTQRNCIRLFDAQWYDPVIGFGISAYGHRLQAAVVRQNAAAVFATDWEEVFHSGDTESLQRGERFAENLWKIAMFHYHDASFGGNKDILWDMPTPFGVRSVRPQPVELSLAGNQFIAYYDRFMQRMDYIPS